MRILIVTPEITYLPTGMGNLANHLTAKAGGLADVSASLATTLFEMGADVHVALPHYRRMFSVKVGRLIAEELRIFRSKLSETRIHLAEDRCFYYRNSVYSYNQPEDNIHISLAFSREVINNILPRVKPDLVHCNDWMTGIIPAAAKRMGYPSIFTVHNIHTIHTTLNHIETIGIDAADFWQHLYYAYPPGHYEQTRDRVPVDFLASGIFASDYINTVSPTFLKEIIRGDHHFIPPQIRHEIHQKMAANRASGILNAPDPKYHPKVDTELPFNFDAQTVKEGKAANKKALQQKLGLIENPDAPILFWPSRLDPVQKGPELLTHILFDLTRDYPDMQLVVVANGPYQTFFRQIVAHHDLYQRVSICDFDERLSRLGYAGSDFVLMPSRFEPCGLPQMIGPIYGTMPIAADTGGIHDTVRHWAPNQREGNGFLFQFYSPEGLRWAIDQAMEFWAIPAPQRHEHLKTIMEDAEYRFSTERTAEAYIKTYRQVLEMHDA
jgi:ADP-glucose type glycogen/starch synthase